MANLRVLTIPPKKIMTKLTEYIYIIIKPYQKMSTFCRIRCLQPLVARHRNTQVAPSLKPSVVFGSSAA